MTAEGLNFCDDLLSLQIICNTIAYRCVHILYSIKMVIHLFITLNFIQYLNNQTSEYTVTEKYGRQYQHFIYTIRELLGITNP